MIVSDNALISYLVIPGEFTEAAERVRELDPEWIAPPLWISEFRNVLRMYIIAGRLPLDEAVTYVGVAEEMMDGRVLPVSSAEVLALVAQSGCTAYDCEYIALAKITGVSLVTTDRALLNAFPETARHLTDFG